MLKTITAQKARTNLGEIINQVYFGDFEFIIQRKGQPMVKIIRLDQRNDESATLKHKYKYMKFAGILGKANAGKMKNDITRKDFLKKLPSKEHFSEAIRDIENLEQNWNRIHIHIVRKPKEKIENEVIFKQKIAELGLTTSEEEVDSRVDEIFEKAGMTDEKAKAICESSRAVYEALMAWQKEPSRGDAIYNEKLADSPINKVQWTVYQACFDTPEKLK